MVFDAENFETMEKGFDIGLAIAEADRCLLCHDAPCSRDCPADTDPGTFIRKFRLRNITGAIRTIKENNILGGACGVLCPTVQLCQKGCSATGIDRPIEIGKLQRFIVEHGWRTGVQVLERAAPRTEKVAVLGSGPAGLSCAAELAKAGYAVTVFEARPEPGGVLRYGVVAFRFDRTFLDRELADLRHLGVEFRCNRRIEGPGGAEELLGRGFEAVFLAPGLWESTPLKDSAVDIPGLYSSVAYLASLREKPLKELTAEFQGRSVAVIGGGSVAMDCVQSAIRLGAADVYLVYRRSYAQMPAENEERIEALEAGVHFVLLNQPREYVVGDDGRIRALRLNRTRLGSADASGRRRAVNIEGSEWELAADVVIEAIGNRAETESRQWYPNVETDHRHLIRVDPQTCQTSVAGIFAGGDIVRGPSLVVNAVRDGKTAAAAIRKYLNP